MRVAWITDPHFNFAEDKINYLIESILKQFPDILIISGDIGEGYNVSYYLNKLESLLNIPIYFVLGNHDFYRSSFSSVRYDMTILSTQSSLINWLPSTGIVKLTDKACLIGHDGWYDGRFGNFDMSNILLNDFSMIDDFNCLQLKSDWLIEMQKQSQLTVDYFSTILPQALKKYDHIYLVTHVPPFKESSRYGEEVSNENWLPFMSCKILGEELIVIMKNNPDKEMTVLCGHTHGRADEWPLENLHVIAGQAEYERPILDRVFKIK